MLRCLLGGVREEKSRHDKKTENRELTNRLQSISKEFNVSEEAAGLTITLFLLGYVAGPLVFAPLSEVCLRESSPTNPPSVVTTDLRIRHG